MKLKFPKKIQIDDVIWNIKYDKKEAGGSFNYDKHLLKIGTKLYKEQPIRTFVVIIHELKEIIQVQQTTRFLRDDCDSDYIFVYDHRQHTDFCYRLAGLLNNFIK